MCIPMGIPMGIAMGIPTGIPMGNYDTDLMEGFRVQGLPPHFYSPLGGVRFPLGGGRALHTHTHTHSSRVVHKPGG